MDGYHMMDEAGNKSGYGYDVLRLMARYWDVDYEYVGYDKGWSDMQRGCFVKGGFYACCTHRAATMASLYTTAVHKTSDSRFIIPISESCFASGL